jgi:hypothetical protein
MAQTNNFIFKALQIIAWVIFVGLSIEAAALLVNFFFSIYKPELVKNLYEKLDLSELYQRSTWVYFGVYSFILFIAVLKAHLFYIVIRLVHKLDLAKPFSQFVSEKISQLSYYTLSIGIISYVAREVTRNMQHHGFDINNLSRFWADSQAFILMAAILYVIAAIFKKGIELQNENDLTV